MPLDVTNDAEIDSAFAAIKQAWGSLDIVVHAVAFAPREALTGGFVESTSREAFKVAHDVSSYSLTALARAAQPLMAGRAGAILTLSYLGAVKSIPSYNVMGLAKASLEANVRFLAADMGPHNIRVNGISAGPIKTLAAAGIAGFPQDAEPGRRCRAAAPQRDARGCGQRRRVPVLGSRQWNHRRNHRTSTRASAPSA